VCYVDSVYIVRSLVMLRSVPAVVAMKEHPVRLLNYNQTNSSDQSGPPANQKRIIEALLQILTMCEWASQIFREAPRIVSYPRILQAEVFQPLRMFNKMRMFPPIVEDLVVRHSKWLVNFVTPSHSDGVGKACK